MITTDIKTILFPTDFSEHSFHSLQSAVQLAKLANSKLIVLNVVDTPFNMENEPVEIDLILNDLIIFAKNKLEAIKKEIKITHGILIQTECNTGDTTASITRAAIAYSADLIIMGTKITKDLFFKSTSFNIVKNTSVPLLSLPENQSTSNYDIILFPFNEHFMTLKKADSVLMFAKLYKSKVVLLGISPTDVLQNTEPITTNLMSLKNMFDKHDIESEVHFKTHTSYSKCILEYCENHKINLVAIANNLTTSLKENISVLSIKDIINHATLPVLTIPVKLFY